jgi:hypothetical protein
VRWVQFRLKGEVLIFCLQSLAEGERRATARIGRELTQELNRLARRAARHAIDDNAIRMFCDDLKAWYRLQNKLARQACKTISELQGDF